MNVPLFSVVIPVYNRAKVIRSTIESVLAQTYRDYELIVVDDGSTDNSSEIAKSYGNELVVLEQENQGPGPARNTGARHAIGRYLAFLDSDDLWFPWTLATYERALYQYPNVAALGGAITTFHTVKQPAMKLVPDVPLSLELYPDYLATHRLIMCRGSGVTVFCADTFRQLGGFPEHSLYCEDFDLLLRMGVKAGFVYIARPMLTALRLHAEGSLTEVARTYAGTMFLLDQERADNYGGGRLRKYERKKMLEGHIWSVIRHAFRSAQFRAGAKLFLRYLRDFCRELEPHEIYLGFRAAKAVLYGLLHRDTPRVRSK
jgi:glycosyltransferase involved in cell wall biosynthesis